MGCIFLIIALVAPRVALVLIYLFTRWFQAAFENWWLPLLGLLLLPYTTLAYLFAVAYAEDPFPPGWWILIAAAVLVDLLHWGGFRSHRKKRILGMGR